MVERWRERWADHVNERLAKLDIVARIDHRSLEAQSIELEPQSQIGAPAQRIEREGMEADAGIAGSVADRRMHQGSLWRCRCRPFVVGNYPSFPLSYSCHPGPKPWFLSRPVGKERGDHTNRRSSTTETTSIHPLPPDPGRPPRIEHLIMPKQTEKS
ncbi:MobA/MobL family protein [Paracoccus sp. S3-43]|uniref:MobA/MobL family protein n=1 Tax=Paracoccus sp. S3-43 TaxID=3030011 RepID=UPI0023B0FF2B|nr:MobA/MobL family protein [Paracoccus sp. S3-43]WEF24740.1 MobA/MobL family protein [Paracoccus sp. S3-43]